MNTNSSQNIKILLKNPEAVLFEGTANSLTSYNTNGLFDVLPFHENFISIIQKEVVIHTEKESKSFPVDIGVMKVASNEISIFLGISTLIS